MDEGFFIASDSVLAFALGAWAALGVSEICLAGFDGHNSPSEISESASILHVFRETFPSIDVFSLGENPFSLPVSRLW